MIGRGAIPRNFEIGTGWTGRAHVLVSLLYVKYFTVYLMLSHK